VSRSDPSPRGLQSFQTQAEEIVHRSPRLRALARRAQNRMRAPKSRLGSLRTDLPVLIRLIKAYARGDYRRLPWKSIVLATTALLYFVTPFDIIPDFIVGTGFLDDAVVVAYVLKAIRDDLGRFEEWEAVNALADPDALNPPY
jgi:uncharacterized membrane protein YkvA (DUF1232 family)